MPKNAKRKLEEGSDVSVKEETKSASNNFFCMEVDIREGHHDQHLHSVLFFAKLEDALKYKQSICKEWAAEDDEVDVDSEEFFNDLEFEEDLEGFEGENHVSIIIKEVDMGSKPDRKGVVLRIGDSC
jgi:hypothetical protein